MKVLEPKIKNCLNHNMLISIAHPVETQPFFLDHIGFITAFYIGDQLREMRNHRDHRGHGGDC